MKQCAKCGEVKATSDFAVARTAADGLYAWCKPCYREYSRGYRERKKSGEVKIEKSVKHGELDGAELRRSYNLKYLYGINLDQYNALLEKQQGACATCGLEAKSATTNFVVDHDHSCCPGNRSCGICVRGILCGYCNTALGQVRDSKETLQNMLDYLS